MKITSKFIYLKHKDKFEEVYNNIPKDLYPIVFVEDTDQLWTCGHWFNIGSQELTIKQEVGDLNKISLKSGDSSIQMIATGSGLSLLINSNGQLEFKGNAITTIDTNFPLSYDSSTNKLSHGTYESKGTYGPTTDLSNTRSFEIPSIEVDEYGHIQLAKSYQISISLESKQLQYDNEEHKLLLTSSNSDNDEIGYTYKSDIIYSNGVLKIPNGLEINDGGVIIANGDIQVLNGSIKGKIEGDVITTPKIHSSINQDYGGASLNLFGHVKLQDIIPTEDPGNSSNNINITDTTNSGLNAIAATPKMVYDLYQKIDKEKTKVTTVDNNNNKININTLNLTDDFVLDDENNLSIKIEEIRE